MKTLKNLLIGLLFSHAIFSAPFLSEAKSKAVLEALDNHCADTWCSGDFDYYFKSFECDFAKATCVLRFDHLDRFISPEVNDVYLGIEHTCVFYGHDSPNYVLNERGLDSMIYDGASICFENKEKVSRLKINLLGLLLD